MSVNEQEHEALLTLEEWARLFRVSQQAAYQQARGRRIEGLIRVGRLWRVSRHVVERQLRGEASPPA